ncbi:MAG: hypothetical protein U0941_26080 [Planctomycetaceae bacterium]
MAKSAKLLATIAELHHAPEAADPSRCETSQHSSGRHANRISLILELAIREDDFT